MKLITDIASNKLNNYKLVTESNDSGTPMYTLVGTYLMADAKNGNGRTYPYDELKREVDKFKVEMISTSRALGELEHPTEAVIDPNRACVRILDLQEDNKTWTGKSVILASIPEKGIKGTVKGDLLLSLVQYGTNMGFSSRAVGEVDSDGVVSDLKLITIDCVANPSIGMLSQSNCNRFVNGILESKEFVLNNHGEIIESLEPQYQKFNKTISKLPKTHISEKKAKYLGKAVHEFLESIL